MIPVIITPDTARLAHLALIHMRLNAEQWALVDDSGRARASVDQLRRACEELTEATTEGLRR